MRHHLSRSSWAARLFVAAAFCASTGSALAQDFGPPALLSDSVPNTDTGGDDEVHLTTDNAGRWVAVWSSSDSLGGTLGATDTNIFVARSSDDGATWTGPAALNSNAAVDSGYDYEPRVSTDGAGNWLTVWHSNDTLGGTIGTDYDILVSRSTDNGATWTAPVALNTNAATDSGSDVQALVTTDGMGNWVVTWASSDTLGGTIGLDSDILVARSTDNGATWTAPAPLNTNAATDSGHDFQAQVVTNGAGNWVVVWFSADSLGGTIGLDADILVARSTDNGATWTAPAPLNSFAASDSADDYQPQLTTDGAGNWVASWTSTETLGGTIGTDYDILVSRSTDNGATWTAAAALGSNAGVDSGADFLSRMTTDGAGNWVATWHSGDSLGGMIGTDDDILVARSMDNGATWSAVAALGANASTDSGTDRKPTVATDGGGNWLAVWSTTDSLGGTIGTDGDILVSRSMDNGVVWTSEAALNTNAGSDTGADRNPQVTTDGAGNWVAVWSSGDSLGGTIGTDNDILVTRSTDDGSTWTTPAALNTNAGSDTGSDSEPQLTTDGLGRWVAVWSSDDDLGGTIGTDADILVARSADNGATWTSPAALGSNAASDSGIDDLPQVTTDASGNWVAVWHSTDSLGGTIGTDYDVLVARSTDHGASWTAPVALNTSAGSDFAIDFEAQVTTDGVGNWLAIWTSDNTLGGTIGSDYDILFARSTDDGATWTAPAPLNSNAGSDSGFDFRSQVTTDGAGNWVATWTSTDSLGGTIGTDQDILVARSSDAGATWTTVTALNGNASSDSGIDATSQVTTDGAGNWLAVWSSVDSLGGTIGTDRDILLARSTDNGAAWSAPEALGTNAGSDAGLDDYPQVTTDGAGHWVAIWESDDALGGVAGFGVTDIFVALAGVCGDGFATGAEDCDDGNMLAGDCCSATCEFETMGSACASDGIVCTDDVCDGAGVCGIGDDSLCDDADACTVDRCEPGSGCQSVEEPTDDSLCLVAPATKLQVTLGADPSVNKLGWQWGKGEAFDQLLVGTPTSSTTYTLCVYDTTASSPVLAAKLDVAPSLSLWSDDDPKGARYKDKSGASDGVTGLQLKTGAAAKTKIKLTAKGSALPLPAAAGATYFDQDPKVVVQLFNTEGACWTSEFTSAATKKHDDGSFKAQTK